MINKIMQKDNEKPSNESREPDPSPNEPGIFHIDGVVKIFDPETKEVFVETRA